MKVSNKILKTILLATSSATILPLAASCTIGEITPDVPTTDNAKVTFQANGGKFEDGSTESKYAYVEKEDKFNDFAHPAVTMDGNQFNGWIDEAGHEMKGDDIITQDIVLTAQWIPVAPDSGDEIVCDIGGEQWIASKETICSDDPQIQIHLTSVETEGKTQSISKSEFNPTNIIIGQDITTLDSYFMYECTNFDGTITFANSAQEPSKLTFINLGFMDSCTSFNSPIILPESVKVLGQSFLGSCSSFKSKLDLSKVVAIGDDFMASCTSFNQQLIVPSTVTFVSNSFMTGCNNFVDLVIETDPYNFVHDYLSTLVVPENSLAAQGVTVSGTFKHAFCTQFMQQLPPEDAGVRNLIEA